MAKPGHFCWACGCHRPNERFSGGGHARHLCKDCSKLGKDELAFRQTLRNIDRLVGWSGVRRKNRARFAVFLNHPDDRVRHYARSRAGFARPYVAAIAPDPAELCEDFEITDDDKPY
jgi:hypothetical protein